MNKTKLASSILKRLGVSPVDILKERYSIETDKKLVDQIAELRNVSTSPVEKIYELEDSPRKCYVWQLDATDKQLAEFTRNVKSTFVQKYNRDPESLHFIRNDINEIGELDPAEIRERVKPWLD